MGTSTKYTLAVVGVLVFTLPVIGVLTNPVLAQKQPLDINRITEPVDFDGVPDESFWGEMDSLPVKTYMPEALKNPSEPTDIRIGYDDEYLYIGARFYDSEPDKIQRTTYKRDWADPTSDQFGLVLDTFDNNETAVGFFTTPTSARSDFYLSNDVTNWEDINVNWNTFWYVNTTANSEGWTMEMRIPWSSLRYQTNEGKVRMGLLAFRYIPRKNESHVYPPRPNKWGWLGHWKPSQAKMIQISGIGHEKPFYITPYVLGGFSQFHRLNSSSDAYLRNQKFKYDAGLDIKYGVGRNLTLDLTVNTDFAQVEADNQQVNLTRFSLFFPEKRKFFQERSSLFDFSFDSPNKLFYSRRIGILNGEQVRILGGARLTGSVQKWDIGAMNMQTARHEGHPSENFGIFRLKRRIINPNSYLGSIFTSRVGLDGSYNYAYGVDGVINAFGSDYLNVNYAQTFDDQYSNQPLSLDNSRMRLMWQTRREVGFGYQAEYSRAGDEYKPGIGFEARHNFTKWLGNVYYGWFMGEEAKVSNHTVGVEGIFYQRNSDGSLESAEFGPRWEVTYKSGSNFTISPRLAYEDIVVPFEIFQGVNIPVGSYTYSGLKLNYTTPQSALISGIFNAYAGQFYDGYRYSLGISSRMSLSPKINLQPNYQIFHIRFAERDDRFTAHLARFRVEYYVNTELAFSTFVQYSNAAEKIISNFRMRYSPREGNDLYIVFNNGLNSNRFDHSPVRPLNQRMAFLIKYNYTFNL